MISIGYPYIGCLWCLNSSLARSSCRSIDAPLSSRILVSIYVCLFLFLSTTYVSLLHYAILPNFGILIRYSYSLFSGALYFNAVARPLFLFFLPVMPFLDFLRFFLGCAPTEVLEESLFSPLFSFFACEMSPCSYFLLGPTLLAALRSFPFRSLTLSLFFRLPLGSTIFIAFTLIPLQGHPYQ